MLARTVLAVGAFLDVVPLHYNMSGPQSGWD